MNRIEDGYGRRNGGFTLVEVLCCTGLLVVVFSLAAPMFFTVCRTVPKMNVAAGERNAAVKLISELQIEAVSANSVMFADGVLTICNGSNMVTVSSIYDPEEKKTMVCYDKGDIKREIELCYTSCELLDWIDSSGQKRAVNLRLADDHYVQSENRSEHVLNVLFFLKGGESYAAKQ